MLSMLESRNVVFFFQESPASVLRNKPARDANQMSPRASIATELMVNSGSRGFVAGSQLSPPLTETATALRFAIATILPATLMLVGPGTPGISSLTHVSPESTLEKRPVAVAANHRLSVTFRAVMRVFNSLAGVGRTGFLTATTGRSAGLVTGVRAIHTDAPAFS